MSKDTHAVAKENGRGTFSVDIEVGGYALQGDEPKAMGGDGTGPAPFDLLTAALAECTAMTIRWYAQHKNIPLKRVGVEVTYKSPSAGTAPAAAAHFDKVIHLEGDLLTDEHRRKLQDIAAKCPIQKVLESSAVITTDPATKIP